ncbi:MAG: glycoside hydrolase family 3 C-terminal domain-containing protein, partial [Lachnospiraceae bacterium]
LLGPAVCIKRSPLCGRNFEYFSEDPYLAGELSAAYIQGVQSHHVGSCIKHFAANNQESGRQNISVEVSERALREIYFPAFETAVRIAGPKAVMCSYNKINGTYASENAWLLSKVLRSDWGFQGFVLSDWGAVNDRVQGVRAGLDLEMPGNTAGNDAEIVRAVREGELDEKLVDRTAERVLSAFQDFREHREKGAVFDRAADHDLAEKIEEESAVLLANNGILPLDPKMHIAYLGAYAKTPRYQGGGSSHIHSYRVVSALEEAGARGRHVTYEEGFPADRDEMEEESLQRAVAAARAADAAVIFAGLPEREETEGEDRHDMKLPACQNRLIEEVCRVQSNTVVVLHTGSPVEAPWADRAAAVLSMYLGGEGVGTAEDRILFGEVNPSGHLAETFPLRLEDNPSFLNFPGDGTRVHYDEGVYVGYRYYDTKKMPVRWAFGHGLSYTTFQIGNLRLSQNEMGDDDVIDALVDVTNTGSRAGKEVVQLYVHDRTQTAPRPYKELKGFSKVFLAPGETKTVTIRLPARALSYWDESRRDWYAASGVYEILVGDAADHITAKAELTFTTAKYPLVRVAGDTTIGQLLSDPRTAPAIRAMIQKKEGDGKNEEPVPAAVQDMPLKALVSFGV